MATGPEPKLQSGSDEMATLSLLDVGVSVLSCER
jgi:hypothetical protein